MAGDNNIEGSSAAFVAGVVAVEGKPHGELLDRVKAAYAAHPNEFMKGAAAAHWSNRDDFSEAAPLDELEDTQPIQVEPPENNSHKIDYSLTNINDIPGYEETSEAVKARNAQNDANEKLIQKEMQKVSSELTDPDSDKGEQAFIDRLYPKSD